MNSNNHLKEIIFAILIIIIARDSYGQKGYTQTAFIKGRGNSLDTIIRKKTEVSFNRSFTNNYKSDGSNVQALRPYIVSDIVNPNNTTHPLYRDRVNDAKAMFPQAKAKLIEVMNKGMIAKELMAKVGIFNEAGINAINFVFLPVYYITPNIVFYKPGENFAKYYNLGTGATKYLMLRNNEPVGYLDFYKSNSDFKSSFYRISQNELESYKAVLKSGKKPIGIRQSIFTDPDEGGGESVNCFGYVEQGHLVLSFYEEGIVKQVGADQSQKANPLFQKSYTIQTAESFFSGSGNGSIISSWLKNTVGNLKNRPPRK